MISGFNDGQGSTHPFDPSDNPLVGLQVDADEAESLRETGEHCPVCLSVFDPNRRCSHRHHHVRDGAIEEDSIADDHRDFRDEIDGVRIPDRAADYFDEVEVSRCSGDFVRAAQEIVNLTGIVQRGKDLFDIFFLREECEKVLELLEV